MSKLFQWWILSALIGNPILAAIILIAVWWTADRFTLGLLPDPFRIVRRWMRMSTLRRTLAQNPNDRRARLELGIFLVEQKRYAAAVELLKPNLAAGDDDPATLFTMGVACLGAGHTRQGELFLDETEQRDPNFRMGELHLVRGRFRLQRGEAAQALESLKALVAARPGTVEGKVLMAQAHQQLGDDVAAAYAKKDAWGDYVHAPRFQRRRDRLWAWRANPARPLTYLAIALVCGALFGQFVAPGLRQLAEASAQPYYAYEPDE